MLRWTPTSFTTPDAPRVSQTENTGTNRLTRTVNLQKYVFPQSGDICAVGHRVPCLHTCPFLSEWRTIQLSVGASCGGHQTCSCM